MPQNPAAFGYFFTNAFPGVTFTNPMAVVSAPGETNRLFIVERPGRIAVITNLGNPRRTVFLNITNKVNVSRDGGLQAMAFHPGFATNGFFYVFYTGMDNTAASGGTNALHDILARFSVSMSSTNFASPATEQKIIRQLDRQADHNGADLHFGPDGYLYVSLGDEGSPGAVGYDYYTNSQCIDRSFFSGVIRIDVDRKPGNSLPNPHPAIVPNSYLVPSDNPFVGATNFNGLPVDPAKVRTEFWAVGLRNPFRFSFDSENGRLFLGDVGQRAYEEINLITRGGNYGWVFREGAQDTTNITRVGLHEFTSIDPIYQYAWGVGPTEGKCVTGGLVYRGHRISQLHGFYVFADYISSKVWAFKWTGTNVDDFQLIANQGGIVGFGTDPSNGDLLAADIVSGTIRRLIYNTNSMTGTPLPPTLAATGVFTNLATLAPSSGVVPYEVNVPFWSDHAAKMRWFSVPNTNLTIAFHATNSWSYPTGTVWIKHFELLLTNDLPTSIRRLETRLLVKNSEGVYGVTYRWGNSITNATLVPEQGTNETFVIRNASGGIVRTQVWRYPSRVECLSCHTPAGGLTAGFNTPQLNRSFAFQDASTNQLQAWSDAGYFDGAITNSDILLALADATNESASIEYRARSFLAANCASCHQPGGVPEQQASWDARIQTPLTSAGIFDGPLADTLGSIVNRVVRRRSLTNSVLYQRVANLGPLHMPPLATSVINTQAVDLLARWIMTPLPVQIGNPGRNPDGIFQFDILGDPGVTSVVQSTTGLAVSNWWTRMTNVLNTNGSATFVDSEATNDTGHFYRVIAR